MILSPASPEGLFVEHHTRRYHQADEEKLYINFYEPL